MYIGSVGEKHNVLEVWMLNTICWKCGCETQCAGSVEVKHNVLGSMEVKHNLLEVHVKHNVLEVWMLNTMCWKCGCETQCVGSVDVKHDVLEVWM